MAKASPGKLINMASGDMAVIERGFMYLPYVIVSPLASLVNLTFLYFIVRNPLIIDRDVCVLCAHCRSHYLFPAVSNKSISGEDPSVNRIGV